MDWMILQAAAAFCSDSFLVNKLVSYHILPKGCCSFLMQLDEFLLALCQVHGCFVKMERHLLEGEDSISEQKVKSLV
jgi:hypothetical protein